MPLTGLRSVSGGWKVFAPWRGVRCRKNSNAVTVLRTANTEPPTTGASNNQWARSLAYGAKLREPLIHELADAGVSNFIISIDAATPQVHEDNRGLPGVCEKIAHANRVIKETGRTSIASVTMSRLVDFDALPGFLQSLGFDCVSFSYPIKDLGSSFLAHSDSDLVTFKPAELDALFVRIKAMKKEFRVNNPSASIDDMRRMLRGEKQRFECLGGYRYFHLDWNLDVWRCHYWHEPMCSIWDFDEQQYVRDGCTACMIDCYRDSSVMQHVAMSMHDAWQAAANGRIGDAAKAIVRPSNAVSVGALLEEFTSIRRYL